MAKSSRNNTASLQGQIVKSVEPQVFISYAAQDQSLVNTMSITLENVIAPTKEKLARFYKALDVVGKNYSSVQFSTQDGKRKIFLDKKQMAVYQSFVEMLGRFILEEKEAARAAKRELRHEIFFLRELIAGKYESPLELSSESDKIWFEKYHSLAREEQEAQLAILRQQAGF